MSLACASGSEAPVPQVLLDPGRVPHYHSPFRRPPLPGVTFPPPPAFPPPRFRVTLAADCPVGTHDLRVVNALGVSNPRAFVVGDLPEALEHEPNDDVDQAQRVELNTTVHGAIASAQDVDYYVFTGKKG